MYSTKNGFAYNLILTDFSMPVMDGIESTRRIREFLREFNGQQPKIIGITGHVTGEFRDKGTAAGMDEILPKPITYAVLEEKVN